MNRRSTATATATAAMLGTLTLALTACGATESAGAAKPAADCKPEHTFKTHKQGVLTVGVISSAPYTTLDPVSKKWTGMDAEWAQAIAKKECLTIDASEVPGQDAIKKLQDGAIDLLSAGAFITPERGQVVGQTDPIYYQYTTVVSTDGVSTVEELKGHTVGVVAGSLYVDPLREALGSDGVKEYPTTQEILADLSNGRIDAGMTASGEAAYQIDKSGISGLKAVRLQASPAAGSLAQVYGVNMPFPKENTELGAALDADIAALRADGTARKILASWHQDDDTTLNGS